MKKKGNLAELMQYAGKHRFLTYASWVLSAISAVLALVPFVYIWLIIREVIQVMPNFAEATHLAIYGWSAVGFALGSMVIYFAALMCSHLSAFRIATNMRVKTLKHITTLPVGATAVMGTGKMRSIINDSSAATETFLAHQLPDMVGAVVTPLAMLALLFVFDWRLGLLSLVPTMLGFMIMSVMTGKKMEKSMQEYNEALNQMNNQAVEYVRGIPVVKTFSQTVYTFKKFKGSIDSYHNWVMKYAKSLMFPMICFTTIINAVFVLLIVAGLCFTVGGVSNTFLLNLIFYIIFTPIISVTLTKVMFMSENRIIVADALNRVHSILEMQPLPEPLFGKTPQDNSIEFKNVYFKYAEQQAYAVQNLSFKVAAGQKVAFVGESGGGKTTVASLISRFWDPASGEVLIGGVNVKEIKKADLANQIAYVFQDSKLLKQSILENVRLARPTATREAVAQALHLAQCDEIIAKLPDGMDTVIGTEGVYLSGGEMQRIAIARLILKDAKIIVLDEATAFADPENETKVQQAFAKLAQGKTVVTIAHRLSTVQDCDQIIVLKGGKIAEQGNHENLLKKGGEYAKMYKEYQSAIEWKIGGAKC